MTDVVLRVHHLNIRRVLRSVSTSVGAAGVLAALAASAGGATWASSGQVITPASVRLERAHR